MELVIQRAALVRELGLARRMSERKSTIPIFSFALFEPGTLGSVMISATDGESMLRTECEYAGDVPSGAFKFLAPVKALHEIARAATSESISLIPSPSRLKIKAGGFRSDLGVGIAEDFPPPPALPERTSRAIPATFLRSAISKVRFVMETASSVTSQSFMHGALLELGAKTRLIATDGRRIAVVVGNGDNGDEDKILIPRKAWDDLAAFLAADDAPAITYARNESLMFFYTPTRQLITRQMAVEFPAWESFFKHSGMDTSSRVDVDRDALLAAVKRVMLVSTEDAMRVKLEISKGQIIASMVSAEVGEAAEPVPAELVGEGWVAGFDAAYIAEFLAESEGGTVALYDTKRSGIFKAPPGDVEYTYLLMRMALPEGQ